MKQENLKEAIKIAENYLFKKENELGYFFTKEEYRKFRGLLFWLFMERNHYKRKATAVKMPMTGNNS